MQYNLIMENISVNDREMIEMIGRRAEEIVKLPEVQKKMISMDRDSAIKYVYMLAIASLYGCNKKEW